MNEPIAIFPNETYISGLRDAESSVIEGLYNEFRLPVVKAIESAGGNYADGNAFFKVSVMQTARIVKSGNYPEEVPIFHFLKGLATAQYYNWLEEKGQKIPQQIKGADSEINLDVELPTPTELFEFRKQIKVKRQFSKLSKEDQAQIQSLVAQIKKEDQGAELIHLAQFRPNIERFKNLLGAKEEDWTITLPYWVLEPLTDHQFNQFWLACQAVERRLNSNQVPPEGENKIFRYAFIAFIMLTLGYAAFTWISRDRSPAKVYENNFQPPESILEDLANRYAADSISTLRPELCTIAFSRADAHYKQKEFREAARELAAMLDDSLIVCQSDALYYLAIVGLQLENPELTIECISKIEDLERYGEDIYWYMALAYVKLAAIDPAEKDIAKRALERAISNTEIPERRVQAEKMLEELSE
ncbi:MAG: hypothetical protein ACKVT2_11365 [Saprospiraceae bacterium]